MIGRLLVRLLYALLTAFVIASAVIYALTGTAPGTRWLLDTAIRVGHLPLHIERSKGSLLAGLDLYGVSWHDASTELRIAQARLRWRPLDLFAGKLYLNEVSAAHVLLVLPAAQAGASTAGSAPLPHIGVPLKVDLARLAIRDIVVVRAKQAWRIGDIRAHASLRRDQLHLGALSIATPQGGLQLVGGADLKPPYSGELRLAWHWRLTDGGRLAGYGTLNGNIDRVDLVQNLSTPFAARLTGHITPRSLKADLSLTWQDARWPLQGSARFTSSRGRLGFAGNADAYTASLEGRISGNAIPGADISLQGSGNGKRFELHALHLATLDGKINGQGAVSWSPTLDWHATLQGSGLNPAARWAAWPGRLNFDAHASGTASTASVELVRLRGSLRQLPFMASAVAAWRDNMLYLSSAKLEAGGGRLQLSGQADALHGTLDLAFDLPRIRNLLPSAHGSLSARAKIDGPWSWPRITAMVHGQGLSWNGMTARRASLDINPGAGNTLNAQLAIEDLRRGSLVLRRVQVQANGTPARHHLTLEADAAQGSLSLAAQGALGAEFKRWRGSLTSLQLTPARGTAWRLSAPAALDISAKAQKLAETCLRPTANGDAKLCLHLDTAGGQIDTAAQLRAVPLTLLAPWLPPALRLAGRIDATGALKGPIAALNGHLQARLDNGELHLRDAGGGQTLAFTVPQLQATLHAGTLTAQARAELPQQQALIQAQADIGSVGTSGQRPLSGTLRFELPKLSVLQPFVTQLRALNGRAQARLTLGGTLAQPRVTGSATLSDGSATLPASGTRLDHVQIKATMPENSPRLTFDAKADSGPGSLQATGVVRGLESGRPQISMQLSGTNFQALNLPQVEALVSPQLSIVADQTQIKVRGKVEVPEAKIKVRRLPAQAVSVSPDAEIVGQTAPRRTGPRIDAEVELLLGNKVSIDALGLSGTLRGNLLLRQQNNAPSTADGSLNIVDGDYSAYGLKLALSRGVLNFAGPVDNPGLDVVAERQSGTVTAKLTVSGTLKSPRSDISADPPMSQANAMSWLLTGHGINEASRSDAALLLRAVYSMNVADNGGGLVSQLEQRTGLSEISVQGGDTLQQSSLVLGKYLTPDIYVRYTTGLFERMNTLALTYRLTRHLSVEAQSGAAQALDLLYQIEFGGR